MFAVNDIVVYAGEGVCKVVGLEEKDFLGEKKTYYVLKPVENERSVCYVPTDNLTVLLRIRKILSKDDIDALIESMAEENTEWIADENERKEYFASVVYHSNHTELIRMIKAVYAEKKEREASGKRLRTSDEWFLKEAKKILHSEFRYVLNLNEEELLAYIVAKLERHTP